MACWSSTCVYVQHVAVPHLRPRLLCSTQLNAAIHPLSSHFFCFCDGCVRSADTHRRSAMCFSRCSVERRRGQMYGLRNFLHFDFSTHHPLRPACAAVDNEYCLLASGKVSKEASPGACTLRGSFVSSLVLFVVNSERDGVADTYIFGAVV